LLWDFIFILVKIMTQGYPAKIILAWAEAVGGNRELRDWLMHNGYMELALFVFAAHLKKDARTWLMKEGFPHLMATLSCAEGDEKACQWLSNHDYEVLAMVGKAAYQTTGICEVSGTT
jgi:hypothetical protein